MLIFFLNDIFFFHKFQNAYYFCSSLMKYTISVLNNSLRNFSLMILKMFIFLLSLIYCANIQLLCRKQTKFSLFSQLTAIIEDLRVTDFQNAMLFPDWLHKITISSRKNSNFFLKRITFSAIVCINSQLFHSKMVKFLLFPLTCFQNAQYFSQLIA